MIAALVVSSIAFYRSYCRPRRVPNEFLLYYHSLDLNTFDHFGAAKKLPKMPAALQTWFQVDPLSCSRSSDVSGRAQSLSPALPGPLRPPGPRQGLARFFMGSAWLEIEARALA